MQQIVIFLLCRFLRMTKNGYDEICFDISIQRTSLQIQRPLLPIKLVQVELLLGLLRLVRA